MNLTILEDLSVTEHKRHVIGGYNYTFSGGRKNTSIILEESTIKRERDLKLFTIFQKPKTSTYIPGGGSTFSIGCIICTINWTFLPPLVEPDPEIFSQPLQSSYIPGGGDMVDIGEIICTISWSFLIPISINQAIGPYNG
jgi:hypothetical protein